MSPVEKTENPSAQHGEVSFVSMALTSEDIFRKIMEKATSGDTNSAPLKRFHVSQTTDQLPDIKVRNNLYRTDLEKQIQDKKERDRRRRELEAYEEEKLLRKIEMDREKLRREYLDEINQRNKSLEEQRLKQQAIARRLEEIQIEEARKRDEETARRKHLLLESLQLKEMEEARRRAEEVRLMEEEAAAKRKLLLEALNYKDYPERLPSSFTSYFLRRPWNSRDYVRTSLEHLTLEEIYSTAPLHILADVYRRLELEKIKMRDIIKRRIAQGEEE